MERAGADAVPIVMLINFLVGFVMAFQGAVQLKQFGANIFVADLVGLSVTRELGPLMTAIIVCGRSGAAFAAELGSMKVSEEIDALRTMGFGPMRFLVLPRALALDAGDAAAHAARRFRGRAGRPGRWASSASTSPSAATSTRRSKALTCGTSSPGS